jgi:type I restriction enzyme R subunit
MKPAETWTHGWKARTQAEQALMADLHLYLTKRASGRDISGLSAYEP